MAPETLSLNENSNLTPAPTVAVIGAGVAGAACAAGLHRAGLSVRLFEKSRGCGGRMSTRRVVWPTDGVAVGATSGGRGVQTGMAPHAGAGTGMVEFDHGAQGFTALHPRFRRVMARAQAAGAAACWAPRVHASWQAPYDARSWVAVPHMPALCRHLLGELPVRTHQTVIRLQRREDAWWVTSGEGQTDGPFDQVVLAIPPAQAAALLVGHHDAWSAALAAVPMEPCWTLMAVTDDVDWPWDAAEPSCGPLAWVARNDRKPGRTAPPGCAVWVAQATSAWSAAHLEDSPLAVAGALQEALRGLLPPAPSDRPPLRWHHVDVHRWRYAIPGALPLASVLAGALTAAGDESWWNAALGLGVCGDFLGGGVEAAWRSGDELADTMAACLEEALQPAMVV